MKLFYTVIIVIMFLSCSSDEGTDSSSDVIVGKWYAIEQYESNTQVEITNCNQYLYVEYKANNFINGGKVISGNLPIECGVIDFELDWEWENLNDNHYRIGRSGEQGSIFTIYKDGVNLVEINPNGTTKIIYEPFAN